MVWAESFSWLFGVLISLSLSFPLLFLQVSPLWASQQPVQTKPEDWKLVSLELWRSFTLVWQLFPVFRFQFLSVKVFSSVWSGRNAHYAAPSPIADHRRTSTRHRSTTSNLVQRSARNRRNKWFMFLVSNQWGKKCFLFLCFRNKIVKECFLFLCFRNNDSKTLFLVSLFRKHGLKKVFLVSLFPKQNFKKLFLVSLFPEEPMFQRTKCFCFHLKLDIISTNCDSLVLIFI